MKPAILSEHFTFKDGEWLKMKKFLFIGISDLDDSDSNGRTLSDVFSFINNDDIFCFSLKRNNVNLCNSNVFTIREVDIMRIKFKRYNHNPVSPIKNNDNHNRSKKNPLTCLIRTFLWKFSFLFWRNAYKMWLLETKSDYIIYNPGDFPFLNQLAVYTSKVLNKKLIIYNTEDFYFKTWNYLHKERGFGFLYPAFRKKLVSSYNKLMKQAFLCLYNVPGLTDIYSRQFPKIKHDTIFHSSQLKPVNNRLKGKNFYYCGDLGKGRDKTLLFFSSQLQKVLPSSKIIVNGKIGRNYSEKELSTIGNIAFEGFCPYKEVAKKIVSGDYILLSLGFLDDYNAKDKMHGFSTKLGDYIASGRLIVHVGKESEEFNILLNYGLGFVCEKEEQLFKTLEIINSLDINPFFNKQMDFSHNFLSQGNNKERIKVLINYEN